MVIEKFLSLNCRWYKNNRRNISQEEIHESALERKMSDWRKKESREEHKGSKKKANKESLNMCIKKEEKKKLMDRLKRKKND